MNCFYLIDLIYLIYLINLNKHQINQKPKSPLLNIRRGGSGVDARVPRMLEKRMGCVLKIFSFVNWDIL